MYHGAVLLLCDRDMIWRGRLNLTRCTEGHVVPVLSLTNWVMTGCDPPPQPHHHFNPCTHTHTHTQAHTGTCTCRMCHQLCAQLHHMTDCTIWPDVKIEEFMLCTFFRWFLFQLVDKIIDRPSDETRICPVLAFFTSFYLQKKNCRRNLLLSPYLEIKR